MSFIDRKRRRPVGEELADVHDRHGGDVAAFVAEWIADGDLADNRKTGRRRLYGGTRDARGKTRRAATLGVTPGGGRTTPTDRGRDAGDVDASGLADP